MITSFKKLLTHWLAIFAVLAVVVFGIKIATYWIGCQWYGYQTERETRYSPFIGCMVKVKGAWYPRNELRVEQ